MTVGQRRLDGAGLAVGVAVLAERDADLAGILHRHGSPPLWDRPPGFETLVRIVLEQQVSLASAEAAYQRLARATSGLNDRSTSARVRQTLVASAVVAAGEERLREAGLTRQKARYVVGLARDVRDGRLDLDAVAAVDDDDARDRLVTVLGIGRWTADIYLLMALGRPDVWPTGDLALAGAMRRAKRLATRPTTLEQASIAETWRPWRAVAARILWHAYLAGER